MKKMSFGKLVSGLLASKDTAPPQMWRPTDRPYPRLADLDPTSLGLTGQEGIYAVWHLGVRPQWLRVGAAADLGAALSQLAQTPWVKSHKDNHGVFVSWAFVSQNQSAGFVRYLAETLSPAYQSEPFPGDRAFDLATLSIACPLPPGTQT
jgi:hypothetical protein